MTEQSRILIVDDNPINVAIVEEILGGEYLLATASSGLQALEVAPHFHPDLVLLDIVMPALDGYETCRRLRADPVLRSAKRILVSSRSEVSERLEGYDSGADDYITKPFDPEELRAKVRVFLRFKHIEELDRLKGDVLTLLDHETRTPLTGLQGALELLIEEDDGAKEEHTAILRLAMQSYRRLQSLLEKSGLLSRFRAGRVKLDPQLQSGDSFLQQTVRRIERLAGERGVTIRVEGERPARMECDPRYLNVVAECLLENAVNYSPKAGEVRVRLTEEDGATVLSVADDGPGIDPAIASRLFSEFSTKSIDHHGEGHGLSLALSREIVQEHGGTIEVKTAPGEGCCFRVCIPAPARPQEQD